MIRRQRTAITTLAAATIAGIIILAAGLGVFAYVSRPVTSITFPSGGTSQQLLNSSSAATSVSASSSGSSITQSSSCTVPSGSGNVTITETGGQPPCGCVLADSNSFGSLYVSTDSRVGDYVCVRAALNDSPQVYLSVNDSAGSVVFSGSCVASGAPGAPPPTGDTCTAYWDTASPDPQGNAIKPGTYILTASDFEGSVVLEANFTLSSS